MKKKRSQADSHACKKWLSKPIFIKKAHAAATEPDPHKNRPFFLPPNTICIKTGHFSRHLARYA